MSGIAVIINRNGSPVPEGVVDAVARSLAHRGPDGLHTTTTANGAILYASLVATPEAEQEQQPCRTGDGLTLVADVRIDNRDELMRLLRWSSPSSTTTDIELLSAAYRTWGDRMVDRIVGDFAAVVVADDGRLRCFRDHLGVKPLYYWCSPEWIVVASGLREISAHPAAPAQLDLPMMGRYLSGKVDDATSTAIAGVSRLPAGHMATIDDRVRSWRYWNPPLDDPIDLGDADAYASEFRRLFREAVGSRLRTPGPVAAQLSGGLDSTSVAAVAKELIADGSVPASELLTFSCLFPGSPRSDEREFIDHAVEDLDLRWQPIVSAEDRPRWIDDDVDYWLDIPLPPDGPDHVALCRAARAGGARVVLTGQGGDDWFDASPDAIVERVWRGELAPAWQIANRWSDGALTSTARMIIEDVVSEGKPAWLHRPGRRRAPWVMDPARAAAGLDDRRSRNGSARRYRSPRAQRALEGLSSGYDAMLKEVLDRIGAKGGIEQRHPYYDRRLVEFAARAPVGVHVTPTEDRALQRRALRTWLPDQIVDRRSKGAFNEVWWREMNRQLDTTVTASRPVDVGWVDPSSVEEIWEATRARIESGRAGGNLFALWGLVQVDALLGRFGPPGPGPRRTERS